LVGVLCPTKHRPAGVFAGGSNGFPVAKRNQFNQGFFLLLLLLLLLVLLGGGLGCSMIFGFSFGGRLSLLFFCANAQAVTIVATSIANRIRFSSFITALLLVFLTHANKGEAESCAHHNMSKPDAKMLPIPILRCVETSANYLNLHT
jgi:hypothetical protein